MYRNYKIIVNTAAGRRRYMQYLVPFVLVSDIVDRYDIWINTHNGADIEFFKILAKKYSKINLCWQPDGIVDGNKSINAFYRDCTQENAIYFKLDDDIVWMEPNAIQKMVDFRIDNPQYFLITPLVINNSLSTYLLQIRDKITLKKYCKSSPAHSLLWKSGQFATALHEWFIEKYLSTDKYPSLYVGKQEMGMTRFSINAILWFGAEMKKIQGVVPGDDEEFLSCMYPTSHGMCNCWNGDVIMAHFAFFTQRDFLDKAGILERYGAFIASRKKELFYPYYMEIQNILSDIATDEKHLMSQPSLYRKPIALKSSRTIKDSITKCIKKSMQLLVKTVHDQIHKTDTFIIK